MEENEPEIVTETVTKTDEEGKEHTETIEKVVDHIVKKEVIYGGIATASESGCRVLARVSDYVIKILVK